MSTTDFGIFYPVGQLAAAFSRQEDAARVRRDLMTGGFDDADCALYGHEVVKAGAQRNLAAHAGLPRLGWSDDALRVHLEAAAQGASFLLIYAPTDVDAARVMNVIRRVPFVFVHRYRRLTIEELT